MPKRPGAEDNGPPRKRQHTAPPLLLRPSLSLAPWSSSDISSDLPPLPKISDPEIEKEAFTHSGVSDGPSYERLEWLGDAYLETIASHLIFNTFRHTSAGRCSQIREQLVKNVTLAEYYRAYNMETKTRLPSDIGEMRDLLRTKPNSRDVIKLQGDIFEAFVAAVAVSDPEKGFETVANWLKALWARTIKDQIRKNELESEARNPTLKQGTNGSTQTEPSKQLKPKDQLANAVVAKGIRLCYEDMPKSGEKKDRATGLPLFIVGVYLDGWGETHKLLGIGSALKKSEAGQTAATRALENKKLIKMYGEKKAAFVQAQKQAAGDAS